MNRHHYETMSNQTLHQKAKDPQITGLYWRREESTWSSWSPTFVLSTITMEWHWPHATLKSRILHQHDHQVEYGCSQDTIKTNTYLITCIPSRISTFLGTAEDLRSQSKNPKIKNGKSDLKNKKYHKMRYHILLSIGAISQLSILSVAPAYAGRISTNKMVHTAWIHATQIPTAVNKDMEIFLSNYATALIKNRTKDFNLSIRWKEKPKWSW